MAGLYETVFLQQTLNVFAALGRSVHRGVRDAIIAAFDKGGLDGFPKEAREDIADIVIHLPIEVSDFVGQSTLNHKHARQSINTNADQATRAPWNTLETQAAL